MDSCYLKKYGKQLLDTATETGLDALKTASKKVVHKAAEPTGEFIGDKITDKIVRAKPKKFIKLAKILEMLKK